MPDRTTTGSLQDLAAPPAATPSTKARWVQAWLACVAFYYPMLWLSLSLAGSGPLLLRTALFGYRLERFDLGSLGASVSVAPPKGSVNARGSVNVGPAGRNLFGEVATLVVVLAAALLVVTLGRKRRTLSGLAVATLANAALVLGPLFGLLRHRSLSGLPLAALYLALLCFGLRRMLDGWPRGKTADGYLRRGSALFASFALLPLLPGLALWLLRGFPLWREMPVVMAPGAAAALLVSLWPARLAAELQPTGWKPVGWGVATSLLVVLGVHFGGAALLRASMASEEKLMAAYPPLSPSAPYPKVFFQKGVNFTVEGPGGYATDVGRQVLESLPQYGVNAVALVPYGFIEPGRPSKVHFGGWERDDVMRVGARLAHARGMKVMLKPAIWEAINLQFSSPEDRLRFFEDYQHYLEHYAQFAKEIHADILCVGGEFQHLTQYEAGWRYLIARVRDIYPGPLVYAANFGSEFENLSFWDALDYIGLQEYYPLPDDLSTASLVEKVEAVQQKFQKPVIFTEVGFPSLDGANQHPWDDSDPKKISLDLQASCYEAILRAFYNKPWFEGMYWWKVGTSGFGGPQDASLTPWDKPAMSALKQWYLHGGR